MSWKQRGEGGDKEGEIRRRNNKNFILLFGMMIVNVCVTWEEE